MTKALKTAEVAVAAAEALEEMDAAEKRRQIMNVKSKVMELKRRQAHHAAHADQLNKSLERERDKEASLQERIDRLVKGDMSAMDEPKPEKEDYIEQIETARMGLPPGWGRLAGYTPPACYPSRL